MSPLAAAKVERPTRFGSAAASTDGGTFDDDAGNEPASSICARLGALPRLPLAPSACDAALATSSTLRALGNERGNDGPEGNQDCPICVGPSSNSTRELCEGGGRFVLT